VTVGELKRFCWSKRATTASCYVALRLLYEWIAFYTRYTGRPRTLIRDPFYRQILERLGGVLDADTFEVCASALIRKDFPTLVPVRGGSDSGMDGVTDTSGPFLICTTSPDVIGNLTKNIKAHLRDSGRRRSVLLATSEDLTQRKRANLEQRARELSFHLRHIYDREALAERLYHEPRWCKELLGLTGRPSALTVIPRTERPLLDHPLVGRDDDLRWLRESAGDRLLVGQPGCGKTYLLRILALDGWGLFLVDEDSAAVADAIRSQQPHVIIVDDAHSRPKLLPALRQLRAEINADFDIVATSWTGDREQVAEALSLPESQIHELGLLTRDEIVEVTKHAGLGGPVELVREIVNQAEGRPGLAVTLSYLSLNGDARGVYFGEALSRSLGTTFRSLVGQEANDLLAAFAIGGNSGMPMKAVADALDISLLQLRAPLVRLAAGGVLRERPESLLSVRPDALRYVLLRDTFFGSNCALPVDALIGAAPDKASMMETLIGAISRGAEIPNITDLLEELGSARSWRDYASLGEREAKFVVRHHPKLLHTIGEMTLRLAPAETLPLLLAAAVGDERELGHAVDHPLRWVEDWIREAVPGTGEAVKRRRALVNSVRRWLDDGGDGQTGLRAAFLALMPTFQNTNTDPGGGLTVNFTWGRLSNDELEHLGAVWDGVKDLLLRFQQLKWERLFSAVNPWIYPETGRDSRVPPDTASIMHSLAARMVDDIAQLSRERPAVQQWVRKIANKLRIDVQPVVEPDFEALFPEPDYEDWEAQEEYQLRIIEAMAERWMTRPPTEVATRLLWADREAALAKRTYPRWTGVLCAFIARDVSDPGEWLRTLVEDGLPGDAAEPFLRKAVAERLPGWEGGVAMCLEKESYEWPCVYVLLTLPDTPDELLDRVSLILPKYSQMLEVTCRSGQLPETTLKRLLRHEADGVAASAAVGVWLSNRRGGVPENIADEWKAAILRAEGMQFWLSEILKKDSALAFEWVLRRVSREAAYTPHEVIQEINTAISVLDIEQRAAVLRNVHGDGYLASELIAELTGDDLRIYRDVLNNQRLREYHLEPLRGHPIGAWADKAVLALDAGYTTEEVVDEAFFYGNSWEGSQADMWQGWVDEFAALSNHSDPRIREVARLGMATAGERRAAALARERSEDVYGR
jgi:hypothetical protein